MSKCKYIYKNKEFYSKSELRDSFRDDPDIKEFGDLAFEAPLNVEAQKKLNKITKETQKAQKAYAEAKKSYLDGEQIEEFKPPYIGVTSFLRGLTVLDANEKERLLTPEFREKEYWLKRIKAWKDPNEGFNDEEIEMFGDSVVMTDPVSEAELIKYLKAYEEGDPDTNNKTLQLIREVKDKWVAQGKIGTAIHDVLKLLFSKNSSGELRVDTDTTKLMNLYFKRGSGRYDEELLSRKVVEDTIIYAKELKQQIIDVLGENVSFFPEYTLTSKLSYDVPGKGDTVLGMIDLLVIDSSGNAHVIDYKASPKRSFNSAKERGFWYQLGLYNRMLQANDISTNSLTHKIMVAPIMMKGFKKDEDTGKYSIEGMEARDEYLLDITANSTLHEVARNLDKLIPEKVAVNLTPEKTIEKVELFNSHSFPKISTSKNWDDDAIQQRIDKNGKIQFDDTSNKYYVKIGEQSFTGDTEIQVFEKVKKFYTETLPKMRKDTVTHVLIGLKKGIKDGIASVQLPKIKSIDSANGASANWFRNILGKYCHKHMKILENPALLNFGIICIHNTLNNQIDFVKITTDDLLEQHKFDGKNNRTLLTGAYTTDNEEAKKSESLAMKAITGNIHLMEMMAVINCMPELTASGATIGELLVANPSNVKGISASNEELKYNFNALAKHIEGFDNNINQLKFATKLDLAALKLRNIDALGQATEWADNRYSKYKSQVSLATELDATLTQYNERKAIGKLEELRQWLEKEYKTDIQTTLESYNEEENIARSLYEKVMLAMASLKGITFRQQFKDNKRWVEPGNPFKKGIQSLLLDNPGNLDNDTLNQLTRLVTEAYQNVREDIQREMVTLRNKVQTLKEAKGFSKMEEMTFGNAASLFKNMIVYKDGDILFKNPDKDAFENEVEREFLDYVLTKINKNRFRNASEADIQNYRDSGDIRYFRVPLAVGDASSNAVVMGGLFQALKYKLNRLSPSKMVEDTKRTLEGVFSEDAVSQDETKLFEMTNMFESGEHDDEYRLQLIRDKGYGYYENNLETLLLKHMFAYSQQKHINQIMPMAKASFIHLAVQGNIGNIQLKNATNYVSDYIRNKIKNEALVDENWQEAMAVVGQLRSAASFMLLAFSPIQYPGQLLQGLWTDIRMVLQNYGDPDTAFTFENFKFAFKQVYQDMFKLGGTPTVCSLLNEYYGMNDMDMNTYIDKIKSDKYGIFNFGNIAFHTVGRPDFFNRMSIFVSQMKKDGTWEAHSKSADGKLIYDWKLDKRFDAYAKGDKSDMVKYNKQRHLFEIMSEQLEKEHALNADGTYYRKGQHPLPKAYTNQQIESYKSVADNIYGYYTHEKKSMIHAFGFGALWMQMRTFWSGKKNQYLGSAGVKLQGRFVQQKDADGKLLYMKEEDGVLVPTTTDTGVPFVKWEGQWQEGVFLTLTDLYTYFREEGFLNKVAWEDLLYNPEYQLARANLIQILYDTTITLTMAPITAALMAGWEDELEKEAKKSKELDDALIATAAHLAIKILRYSYLDLNYIESIGSPLLNWQPVAFEYYLKRLSDLMEVAIGDKDVHTAIVNASGALGSTRLIWNTFHETK